MPVIFKNKTTSWALAGTWNPSNICSLLAGTTTSLEVCPKQNTTAFAAKFKNTKPVFETQCEQIQATLGNFRDWLGHNSEEARVSCSSSSNEMQDRTAELNPLLSYPRSQYWIYANYKYMSQLCPQSEVLLKAVDWGVFGFAGRDGKESTIWIGSEGAFTPCHYDTYGCNLVAQLWGKKQWTLVSPTDSQGMYPTRVPYEESSVFSEVNLNSPDYGKYPAFKTVTLHRVSNIPVNLILIDWYRFQAILEPGDVLLVPRHWWHFVECMEPSVSVNTWIDLVRRQQHTIVCIYTSPQPTYM